MTDRDVETLRTRTQCLRRDPSEKGLGCACGGEVHLGGDYYVCARCFRMYESVAELAPLPREAGHGLPHALGARRG